MIPELKTLKEKRLVGKKMAMSYERDRTAELWRSFSPERKKIKNTVNDYLYSVEIYPDTDFFKIFDPAKEFEKWAAVEVNNFDSVPDNMNSLVIPEGQYAVFHYVGKPSEAQETFRYIYGSWLPNSGFEMENRPHFALMGIKYKGEDPESEEDFWVPVKKKTA